MDYERFITLKEAARTFNLTEAEMRRAAASGSLRFIGKAKIRTRASWVEEHVCRESERPSDSAWAPSGLSEADRAASAQAALNRTLVEMRSGLRAGRKMNRS